MVECDAGTEKFGENRAGQSFLFGREFEGCFEGELRGKLPGKFFRSLAARGEKQDRRQILG